MAHYSLASNGLLAGLRAAMCAAKPYFAEPCPQKYNDPPSWRAQVGCFKVFDRLISTSSNCGCLQTGPQSRQRATWYTIPLQAMVFWLACELLCVLPSLILLNLAPRNTTTPPSWRAQVGCFKVFECLISTSSNCSCLQTGPQSRQRATWHTIPLQAMVFWLACELLCVLPSLILLNLAPRNTTTPPLDGHK